MTGPSGTTRFLYDGDRLVMEYDGAGNVLRSYVHGPGTDEPLAWYEASAGWAIRYLHADSRGSIVALADANGNPVAINTYDEYGIPGANNQGRFGYTGQTWISELGMYYYKTRIYSPTLGRFLQVDPIGYDDQINLYAYVGNDPLNLVDVTGQRSTVAGSKIHIQPFDRSHPSISIPRGSTGARGISGREQAFHHYNVSTASHRRNANTMGDAIAANPTPGRDRAADATAPRMTSAACP